MEIQESVTCEGEVKKWVAEAIDQASLGQVEALSGCPAKSTSTGCETISRMNNTNLQKVSNILCKGE